MKLQSTFVSYLLLPVICFFIGLATIVLNKKNSFVSNKTLIIFCLLFSIIIALPGIFSLANESFPKFYYNLIQVVYFILGFFYVKKIDSFFKSEKEYINKSLIILVSLMILTLGSYLFSLIFNYIEGLNYGLIASTCTYTIIIPVFIKWTYQASLKIPSPIFKVWTYNPLKKESNYSSDTIEAIVVLELELSKQIFDKEYVKVKAKAPLNYVFGDWFQLFIHDHNIKYSESPINYLHMENKLDEWIFYTKPSLFKSKTNVDFEKTIEQNNLTNELTTIVCKRVNFSAN